MVVWAGPPMSPNFDVAPVDPNKQAMPPVAQGEPRTPNLRPQRVKPECAGPNFNATKTALNHVNRTGHTSEVDPFTGSSGLRNFQVRAQGPVEESDRVRLAGCEPGPRRGQACSTLNRETSALGSNRSSPEVERRSSCTPAHPTSPQARWLTAVRQHQDIRLFGCLIVVHAVVLGFHDSVEPRHVAVPFAKAIPIELSESS